MYLYRTGHYAPDGSTHFILLHEIEFSEEQFENLVLDCLGDLFLEELHRNYKGVAKRIEEGSVEWREMPDPMRISFLDLSYDLPDRLSSRYGFRRAMFQADYEMYDGFYPVTKPEKTTFVDDLERANRLVEHIRKKLLISD